MIFWDCLSGTGSILQVQSAQMHLSLYSWILSAFCLVVLVSFYFIFGQYVLFIYYGVLVI